ncbi:MAG: right-handed parallel beta-helix repeat-containing protein [Armatimonadota bacterium]
MALRHYRLVLVVVVLVGAALLCMMGAAQMRQADAQAPQPAEEVAGQTWVEIDGVVYGARPDERGPIGGGEGYAAIVTGGDYVVESLEQLIEALAQAQPGRVVFIPDETEIDLTTFIYIDEFVLEVPAGVTLAGERGNNGSLGAILTSDALKTPFMIRALGPNVRITGLRIRGPNPKRYLDHHRRAFSQGYGGHTYYYKFPTQNGIATQFDELEVDNCEISAFGHAGIYLMGGVGHHVHHNYIHHCQYNGLGYGICHDVASSMIECNLFDWNRHSIAGTGRPGCGYVARNNVELGTSLSHCFDMHGGRDRGDGTDIAGTRIEIYNNTFRAPQRAVVIRGVPQDVCQVHHNWFAAHADQAAAVSGSESTEVYDNHYGPAPAAEPEIAAPAAPGEAVPEARRAAPDWAAARRYPRR